MYEKLIGFRFNTLYKNFSNSKLMAGSCALGAGRTVDEYYDYLTHLSTNETPFYIVTPKHLGGNRLTVPKLNQLIEQYKPGIVGIDQISLMDDVRRQSGDPQRIQYSNISED